VSKVWFITGTSKGFGRIWAEAALERGDKVAATARNADSVAELAERYGEENALPVALDVTDKGAVHDAVGKAHEHFGRLDVVVNNAGYRCSDRSRRSARSRRARRSRPTSSARCG